MPMFDPLKRVQNLRRADQRREHEAGHGRLRFLTITVVAAVVTVGLAY